MRSISFITMIMSAAVLSGIVTAQNPNGNPCTQYETYLCGSNPGYNNGNPYLYFCSEEYFIEVMKTCSCSTCCNVINGGNKANGGSFTCT
ncbi:hypothetical protein BDR07DRAFT_1393600 [Suillus spraguei]|nr:hypothetical protein BDR07DRAFT_1393600 [Suillus spraguei]